MLKTAFLIIGALIAQTDAVSLSIKTTVGTINGFINNTVPNVRQFQGIPFAQPPVANLRWAPPTKKGLSSNNSIDATYQRATCSQTTATSKSIYSEVVPQYYSTPPFGEDCLYLNIYAPVDSECRNLEPLPVIIWIHGGGNNVGGIQTAYQLPMKWVERTRDFIIVQVNYRVNIFGWPNAAGLDKSDLNLGIMDQRLAIEWVRDNIASFGGDPSKMLLWGQSAGAADVDILNFAYPSDPIVHAFAADSGVATLIASSDVSQSNFTFVANQLGCNNPDDAARLACMRLVPQQEIEDFLFNYTVAGRRPSLSFAPIADGRLVFTGAEYGDMRLSGNYSKLPMIIGSNANEGASFVSFNATNPNFTAMALSTLNTFTCPAARAANLRSSSPTNSAAPTFRYQYYGNFSNISPLPWMGAYHSSELPMLFGTHGDFRGESTVFQKELSEKMQDLWVGFARAGGELLVKSGWPIYDGINVLLFGKGDVLTQVVDNWGVDVGCSA